MSEGVIDDQSEGEQLAELGKRRGFFFPSYEAYGGVAGFYTYGPRGAAVKRHLEASWRDRFALQEGNFEIEGPTVTPEAVLDASGHTKDFADMLVECTSCGETHRADHLVEDNTSVADAESLSPAEVADLIAEHDLQCPACGASLVDEPVDEFNLMFETAIGPGDGSRAFLRPETAQAIFVEFPRLVEYAREQLPFGVTQIGTGYRNEISPRRGLVRVREFTMAELEYFIDPERDEPDLSKVGTEALRLFPAAAQGAGEPVYQEQSVQSAVEEGVIGNAWVGYFLAIANRWYAQIGIDPDRLRFRQHLAGERAHYATDCWDAEAEIDGDWIEIAGFAHRGCYDLEKHANHSQESFTVFRPYEEPQTRETPTVDPDMAALGPEFGGAAPDIAAALNQLVTADPEAFTGDTVTVEVGGEAISVPVEQTGFAIETTTETGEHLIPQVVEPSFGVGRTVYAILAHSMEQDEVDGEPRTYLSLPAAIAPTTVAVFPLMDRDGLGERATAIASSLRAAGFAVDYDDSGNIGRRYRRQDEIGTPYCVTVDYETLDDDSVTIRDRDTTEQHRVQIDELEAELTARVDAS